MAAALLAGLVLYLSVWIAPRPPVRASENEPAAIGEGDTAADPYDGILAETVGLLLHYAWLAGDRGLFDHQVGLVQYHLMAPCGLLAWRASLSTREAAPASASVDDLKVIRALLGGGETWGDPAWGELVDRMGAAVLQHEVVDNVLVEAASWDDEGGVVAADVVETAYLDLKTVSLLIPRDPAWLNVYTRSLDLLRSAETEHGLFPRRITREGVPIATDDGVVNMIHVLYAALHMAEVNEGGDATLGLLRERFDATGRLPGRFVLATAERVDGFESLSIYALASRLARARGEQALARRFLDRMLEMQLLDPVVGSPDRSTVSWDSHSFDNLQALIALREEASSRSPAVDAGGEEGG